MSRLNRSSKASLTHRHLIEPRFDEFKSAREKETMLGNMSIGQDISLEPFKRALGSITLLSAGGYGPSTYTKALNGGISDLVAFGRYFMSVKRTAIRRHLTSSANADLISRLRGDQPLYSWDRDRFYGPFLDNEVGYTIHQVRNFSGELDHQKGQLA